MVLGNIINECPVTFCLVVAVRIDFFNDTAELLQCCDSVVVVTESGIDPPVARRLRLAIATWTQGPPLRFTAVQTQGYGHCITLSEWPSPPTNL